MIVFRFSKEERSNVVIWFSLQVRLLRVFIPLTAESSDRLQALISNVSSDMGSSYFSSIGFLEQSNTLRKEHLLNSNVSNLLA